MLLWMFSLKHEAQWATNWTASLLSSWRLLKTLSANRGWGSRELEEVRLKELKVRTGGLGADVPPSGQSVCGIMYHPQAADHQSMISIYVSLRRNFLTVYSSIGPLRSWVLTRSYAFSPWHIHTHLYHVIFLWGVVQTLNTHLGFPHTFIIWKFVSSYGNFGNEKSHLARLQS